MKKAEQQKTTFGNAGAANGPIAPTPPVTGNGVSGNRRWADPSSTERSNRYPLPSFGYRMRTTE